jgi:hypothetical protein
MRILALALLVCGLLAGPAAAKSITASVWTGKLIVVTDSTYHHERQKPGYHNASKAQAKTVMSGRARRVLLPYVSGQRSWALGGGGSLQQLQGSVDSTYLDADWRRTIDVSCHGELAQNSSSRTLQFRTQIGYSGHLKLVVDGLFLRPEEKCTHDEYESPIHIDGWPEDWVFGLPAAPQSERTLELQSDWWSWRENCGEGDEREGHGAPPGIIEERFGDELCSSGIVTRIHTLLDLRRTCAKFVMPRVTRNSADGRCVART